MQKKTEPTKEPLEIRLKRAQKELKERAKAHRVQNAKRLKGAGSHRIGPC